jgi:hypothetical protein
MTCGSSHSDYGYANPQAGVAFTYISLQIVMIAGSQEMSMYKAPLGPVETLQKALRKDLQDIPMPEPSKETAQRMAQILQDIAQAMRAVDEKHEHGGYMPSRHNDDGVYWRRCS